MIGGYDVYNNDADPMDDQGHGTHVAGIIASRDSSYQGVAPGASLVGVKALNSQGSGYASDVLSGISWCVHNKDRFNISTISLSLGCDGAQCVHYQNECSDDLLAGVINEAYDNDITVFIATGNSGWTDGISNPACVPHAIAVGGVSDTDGFMFNRGKLVDVVAPGSTIYSTYLNAGWQSFSGTSMATPHAAALSLLISDYFARTEQQHLTPDEILLRLQKGVLLNDTTGSHLILPRADLVVALTPVLTFTNNTLKNGSASVFNSTLIEVRSDVALQEAYLELLLPNGTVVNTVMNRSNSSFYSLMLSNLSFGIYSFSVIGIDSAGFLGRSELRDFSVLQEDITLNINSPLSGSYYGTDIPFEIMVNGTLLSRVGTFLFNSSYETGLFENQTISGTSFNHSMLIDISGFSDGNYALRLFAQDSFGSNLTNDVVFEIDRFAPAFGVIHLNPTSPTVLGNLTISFELLEKHLNYTFFSTNVSGGWVNYTLTSNSTTFNYTFGDMVTSGPIYYFLIAQDLAGNYNKTGGYFILSNVSLNDPLNNVSSSAQGMILSPTNGSVFEAGEEYLFNAASNESGNMSYRWDFGDDNQSFGLQAVHRYFGLANRTVRFYVMNATVNKSDSVLVVVNDNLTPVIQKTVYPTQIHLEDEKSLRVDTLVQDGTDLKGVLTFADQALEGTCAVADNATNCSWQVVLASSGPLLLSLNITDSAPVVHSALASFEVTVLSCSDGVANGLESGVDCG